MSTSAKPERIVATGAESARVTHRRRDWHRADGDAARAAHCVRPHPADDHRHPARRLLPAALQPLDLVPGRKISSAVAPFVGLRNYSRIIGDPEVWNAIRVSLIFTFASVLFSFLIGFGLALLLNRQFRGGVRCDPSLSSPGRCRRLVASSGPGCSTTSSGSSPPSSAISACERSGWGATGRSGRDRRDGLEELPVSARCAAGRACRRSTRAVRGCRRRRGYPLQRFWNITVPLIRPVAWWGSCWPPSMPSITSRSVDLDARGPANATPNDPDRHLQHRLQRRFRLRGRRGGAHIHLHPADERPVHLAVRPRGARLAGVERGGSVDDAGPGDESSPCSRSSG